MFTLVKLLVVGSAAFVYHDAAKNRIGRVPGGAAGARALGSLFP